MNIGGVEFPEGITCNSASCYISVSPDTQIIGWEFHSPTISPSTLIVQKENLSDAAEYAFKWFERRGHFEVLGMYKPTKEHRLVAFIFPEMDGWGLGQINESDRPVLAAKDQAEHPQFGFSLCEVAAPRGEPTGRMVTEFNRELPTSGATLDRWKNIIKLLQDAVSKPPLYKEDFTFLGVYGRYDDTEE